VGENQHGALVPIRHIVNVLIGATNSIPLPLDPKVPPRIIIMDGEVVKPLVEN
jgi:hypothetical protein